MSDFGTADEATETTMEDLALSMIEPDEPEDAAEDDATPAPDEDQTDAAEADAEPLEGDDALEDAEDEEESASEQEQLFAVKVDGTEENVTLDELTRGYSGQKHIQRGMEEVANARKEAEAYQGQIAQQRQQLGQLIQAQQQGGFIPPTPPDMALMQTDPIGYMQQKEHFEQANAAYQGNLMAYQQQVQAAQQQQQADHQSYLQEQRQIMLERIPELGDAEKAPIVQRQMIDVALNRYGFTTEEIEQISDSRYAVALHDLARFHASEAAKGKALAKAEKARPVAKAGAKTDQKRGLSRKQRERLKASGSDADALALMLKG